MFVNKKNNYFFLRMFPLYSILFTMGENTMGVVILFGLMIGLIGALIIIDQINWSKYPISDEYWIAGMILISFLAAMIVMIL